MRLQKNKKICVEGGLWQASQTETEIGSAEKKHMYLHKKGWL